MKINLEVENKEVVFPEFDLFKDQKHENLLLIVIKNIDFHEDYITNNINNQNCFLYFDNQKISLVINNYIYNFNINILNFSSSPEILFDFYDNNGKIKKQIKKIIKFNEN